MADKRDTKPGMATEPPRVYGPRTLGALLPRVVRPAFRSGSPAASQVMADWAAIVGPMLASVSAPRRLAAGTLTIACAGPVAMELQHYATELISRINTHLGTAAVRTLRFIQTTAVASPPAQPSRPIPPEVTAAAESAVAALPEGELREALAALGRAVLTHGGGQRSTNRSV